MLPVQASCPVSVIFGVPFWRNFEGVRTVIESAVYRVQRARQSLLFRCRWRALQRQLAPEFGVPRPPRVAADFGPVLRGRPIVTLRACVA
eukprot:tig00000113_g5705.t1